MRRASPIKARDTVPTWQRDPSYSMSSPYGDTSKARGGRPYSAAMKVWPNLFRGITLGMLAILLGLAIGTLVVVTRKDKHDWCVTGVRTDPSMSATFSWGMNLNSIGGLPFYYNLSTWESLGQISSAESANLLSEGIAFYTSRFGIDFSSRTPDATGQRVTANNVFVLKQLTAMGPYDMQSFTDYTGSFCDEFDRKHPPRAVLVESTVTINSTAFGIAYPSGTNYDGDYEGPVLVNDALAYGMYIFRHPVSGKLYFKIKMRSLVPGRQIPDAYPDHTVLNENFQYCSAEFGPGTGVLQVIIGFAEALQGIFRVWLNQKAVFSPLNSIPTIPPWDNCVFV